MSEQDYRVAEKRGVIVCGFAGVGKSTTAKNHSGWVDLESTPFNKNWKLYVDVIDHMSKNGYHVMVSCHRELRDELLSRNIEFYVVAPSADQKDDYIERYKRRGNTEQFIAMMDKNWCEFINDSKTDGHIIQLHDDEYMESALQECLEW